MPDDRIECDNCRKLVEQGHECPDEGTSRGSGSATWFGIKKILNFKRNPKILKMYGDPAASFYPAGVVLAKCDKCGAVPGNFIRNAETMWEGVGVSHYGQRTYTGHRALVGSGPGGPVYKEIPAGPATFHCRNCGALVPFEVPDEDPDLPIPKATHSPEPRGYALNSPYIRDLPKRRFDVGLGRRRMALRELPGFIEIEAKIKYEKGVGLREIANYINSQAPEMRANKDNVNTLAKKRSWQRKDQ